MSEGWEAQGKDLKTTSECIRKSGRPWYDQTAVTRPYLVDTV